MADLKPTPDGDLINFDNIEKISITKTPAYALDHFQTKTLIEMIGISGERYLHENNLEWRQFLKNLSTGGE